MSQHLINILQQFKGKKVMVLGDIVLDEYWHGTTGRVSREAPVLILDYEDMSCALGGAANAVQNLITLGAEVLPISVLGKDDSSQKVINMLKRENVSCDGIICEENVISPTKVRIMAGCMHTARQQVMRIDKHHKKGYSKDVEAKIIKLIHEYSKTFDALIVSDYGLGVLSSNVVKELNKIAGEQKIPVVVDSRYSILEYKNISLITPNEEEVSNAINRIVDEKNVEEVIKTLSSNLNSKAVLITMGKAGMALYSDNEFLKIPIVGSQEAIDVTGAGDTVTSVITLAYISGASFSDAAKIANAAASVVIMERGATVITLNQLEDVVKKNY